MRTKKQSYKVMGNKTAADVVASNDQELESHLTLSEAMHATIQYQRDFAYTAAWIEAEEAGKPATCCAL